MYVLSDMGRRNDVCSFVYVQEDFDRALSNQGRSGDPYGASLRMDRFTVSPLASSASSRLPSDAVRLQTQIPATRKGEDKKTQVIRSQKLFKYSRLGYEQNRK